MSKPGRKKASYSGFIIPESGELVVTKSSWFNYENVIQSLREFMETKPCPEGNKYCIVLDNAPWHKKAIRLIWTEQLEEYADIREKMEAWPMSKLINVLDDYFAQFFMPNDQLKSLCSFSCFA